MIIAVLTDIHGEAAGIDKIAVNLSSADYILIAGDITHFGNIADADIIISSIEKYNKNIYAVPGNCDYPEVGIYLEAKGCSADRKVINLGGSALNLIGAGGSIPAPVFTPNTYSEKEYDDFFKKAGYADILLSHQPPYNTQADKVLGLKHVGSTSVRKYIEKAAPLLCICGHIHESAGKSLLGKTHIINPGPFKNGYYCMAEIADGNPLKAEILNFNQ